MKQLNVIAAGFGHGLLERAGTATLAGLSFEPAPSVFPAVTCVAQASLRTGLRPVEHGVVSNGVWMDALQKPLFWEQSARLVGGRRVWADRRAAGARVGLYFLQQSLGEAVDQIISPAPIHKHGGGMIMSCYTQPTGMSAALEKLVGRFPLWRYWGPFASPKVGRTCIDWFAQMTEMQDVDEAYLYLPTLDYFAQKYGPGTPADRSAFRAFVRQLEWLADLCQRRGCALSVTGDYEITPVTAEPVRPNVVLRRHALFRTRAVRGLAYPDFYASTAFAVCDHEFCIIYGPDHARAAEMLLATGDYERPTEAEIGQAVDPAAKTLLLARRGSWCDYRWWTDRREAPDFAAHVDIHNKPGYDPTELFFFGRGIVKGTHGRSCLVAQSKGNT
ncbi:MAG: alkaline phosphatase family protein [Kiritimatiellia bacterium]